MAGLAEFVRDLADSIVGKHKMDFAVRLIVSVLQSHELLAIDLEG